MGYKSCSRLHTGFNFYRSGKITASCNQISPELELAHVDDEDWRTSSSSTTDGCSCATKWAMRRKSAASVPPMIATAKNYGVQNLVLSRDMNVPASQHPEYVAKAKEFLHLVHRNGMSLIRGAFLPEF